MRRREGRYLLFTPYSLQRQTPLPAIGTPDCGNVHLYRCGEVGVHFTDA